MKWVCRWLHRHVGPFRDEQGDYRRCLDCGARIPWSDPPPRRPPPRRTEIDDAEYFYVEMAGLSPKIGAEHLELVRNSHELNGNQ